MDIWLVLYWLWGGKYLKYLTLLGILFMTKEEVSNSISDILLNVSFKGLMCQVDESTRGSIPVLIYLAKNQNQNVCAGDISDNLNLTSARIAVILNKLSEKNLVEKFKPLKDKRITLVKITVAGLQKVEEFKRKLKLYIFSSLSSLTEEESELLLKIILKLLKTNAIR